MRTGLAALILLASSVGCVFSPSKSARYEPPDERFVLFSTSSSEVTSADGFFALGYVAAMLEEHPTYRVLVVGHADTSGTSDRNRELSLRRARSVRKILASHGVSEGRVLVAASQSSDPTMSAALSRRADVYLFDPHEEDVTKRLGYPVDQRPE